MCAYVTDRSQERKGSPFVADPVLPPREGDALAESATAFPDGEADKLQAVEFTARKVQFSLGELPAGLPRSVRLILRQYSSPYLLVETEPLR